MGQFIHCGGLYDWRSSDANQLLSLSRKFSRPVNENKIEEDK